MPKSLIFLIGPKGSGKTYIGTRIAAKTDIPFLRVEPIWLTLKAGEDGWEKVEAEIDRQFTGSDWVVLESLGGSEGFKRLRNHLSAKYALHFIRIQAPLDVCYQRLSRRTKTDHLNISDENVQRYNEIAARIELPWSAEIRNHPPASDEDILRVITGIRRNIKPCEDCH